jgi:TonB-linked SusC/RagA family outer membrane protein
MKNSILKISSVHRELPVKILRIMNVAFILLTVTCLQVSARGFSQNVTIQGKNVSIEDIFSSIKAQTGYTFWYNLELIKKAKRVNVDIRNKPLKEALDICFNGQPFTYQIVGKTIVLKEKDSPLPSETALKVEPALPPPHEVHGRVINENGEPLAGVSVTLIDGNTGTSTGADGSYSINVPENATLVFSFVGYTPQTVNVNTRTTIDIKLMREVSALSDIVVVGYGTQKKIDVTGSITTVSGDDIAKTPSTNPLSSLQGKVAGLTIVNSGRAGSSPTVRIRGVNSTNTTDPLYVVDGIFETNIDYLNPADIESISVLRDPSSVAIFGILGGSGVIIVTTKRAKKGETRISFQSSIGMQRVNNRIAVTDANGFKKLYSAQLANLGAAPFDYTNFTANTNWQDLIFRDAILNTNNLSVSSSGEKSTTLFNIGYNNQQGVLKYDHYQKFIARLNEEIKFNKNIKIGGDITGYYYNQQDPSSSLLNNALWATPIVPAQANENTYYNMPSFQYPQVGDPMANLNQSRGNAVNKGYRILGSMYAEIKFLQHFTLKSSFYSDLQFVNRRSYAPLPYNYIKIGENGGPTDTTFDESVNTSVTQFQSENRKFQQDHLLTYENTFNNKHHITALAGFTTLYEGNSEVTGNRRDTILNIPDDPDFWYLGVVNANNPVTNDGKGGEESYMSFLGRINYSYNDRYLLNLTYRRDGTSKFAPDRRWGDFGSAGVGWVISKEAFFQKVKTIDYLKLKGAWGTVGNALGLAQHLYLPGLNTANVGVFGDNVYGSVKPAYVPDPNLHWEVVRGLDIGVEARLLQNRLNAELTYYDRTTKDILTKLTLPGTAGDYQYYTNLGNISNKGIEVTLGWNDGIGKDFTYSLSGNFSYNKNEVVSIGNNINFKILGNAGVNVTETGKSIGYFYGYTQTGIYQTVQQLDKTPGFSNSLPGDISYADLNGDGIISDEDRSYLGTPFPPYNFGVNLNLGYKGFDFLFEGQGVAGNKIYTQRRNATFAVLNYETNRLNAWTEAGSTNIEPILQNSRGNNYLFSTYFLEPGDYFRIRTIQLGYTFSKQALSRTGIKQIRLYLSGQNVATFSRVTGYTPEVSLSSPTASGADNGTYPVPSVYSFGINATF